MFLDIIYCIVDNLVYALKLQAKYSKRNTHWWKFK